MPRALRPAAAAQHIARAFFASPSPPPPPPARRFALSASSCARNSPGRRAFAQVYAEGNVRCVRARGVRARLDAAAAGKHTCLDVDGGSGLEVRFLLDLLLCPELLPGLAGRLLRIPGQTWRGGCCPLLPSAGACPLSLRGRNRTLRSEKMKHRAEGMTHRQRSDVLCLESGRVERAIDLAEEGTKGLRAGRQSSMT